MDLLRNIWDFFQYQILGMKWLNELIGNILNMFGIDTTKKREEVFNFLSMT